MTNIRDAIEGLKQIAERNNNYRRDAVNNLVRIAYGHLNNVPVMTGNYTAIPCYRLF